MQVSVNYSEGLTLDNAAAAGDFWSISVKPPVLNVSYKPQKISPKSQGTVRMLLHEKIRDSYIHPQFITDVIKPLQVEQLYDQEVCGIVVPGWPVASWIRLQNSALLCVDRFRIYLVVSCREWLWPSVLVSQLMSIWLMSPPPTWTLSSVCMLLRSSKGKAVLWGVYLFFCITYTSLSPCQLL